MAREKFENRNLSGPINVACKFDDGTVRYWNTNKEDVIEHIVDIVNEYSSEGYVLTLRQLHYQLVKSNWIVNHDTAYKRLGGILDDCRYGGIIDWDAIEDRGRIPFIPYSVDGVDEALQDTVDQYRINRQEGQKKHIELWTEKDALSGILKRTTSKYHVKLVVNKGYTSSSAIYNAYERVISAISQGQSFIILYFGDHDPSGLDMVRDIKDRLVLFLTRGKKLRANSIIKKSIEDWWEKNHNSIYDVCEQGYCTPKLVDKIMGDHTSDEDYTNFLAAKLKMFIDEHELFKVIPIGLTIKQIKTHKLPPNPTKLTDSRADKYIEKFGKTCWEVDALNPKTLTAIVEKNIIENIDVKLYNKMLSKEAVDLRKLKKFIGKKAA